MSETPPVSPIGAPPPHDAENYLGMLQALLPRGLAWTCAPDSVLTRTLQAVAEELAKVDAAARLLPDEANPASAKISIEDWERVLGLPDGCLPAGSSLQERRDAVLAKLGDLGRQDVGYWYGLAETLGYGGAGGSEPETAFSGEARASAPLAGSSGITIEEHWPFCCGFHECGDPRAGWTPNSGMSIELWEQEFGYPIGRCGPPEMRYWWNVIVHGDNLILFRCGESLCPERLMDWRSAVSLECVMHRDKEAHTLLTFEYREE
jgi:uncharacterized protein YmfQ (DUF2313 family)